jgi:hypothetical protein
MQRSASRLIYAGVLCAIAAAAACGDAPDAPERRGPFGVLVGRVLLADAATLPAYAPRDLRQTAVRGMPQADVPPACGAAAARAASPVALAEGRALSNIVVAASDFTHLYDRKSVTHRVEIHGCALAPRTIVARAGDRLLIENRDAIGFEPLIGPSLKLERIARGEHVLRTLEPGIDAVACTPRAPCGRTDVVVLRHPVAAVTDAYGAFRIEHFPAREVVRVTAWHPLFEESEAFVWVEPGKQSSVDLVLTPKPRFR